VLILEVVNTGKVRAVIDLAGAPAQDRLIGARIAAASDEFECETDVLKLVAWLGLSCAFFGAGSGSPTSGNCVKGLLALSRATCLDLPPPGDDPGGSV
jgi:hypothetical protein